MANNNNMGTVTAFKPSTYQERIFDWVRNDQGNAFVNAVAGSGKTTTLVKIAEILASEFNHLDAVFLAFNGTIVKELGDRLPMGFKSQTINSLGHRALMSYLGKKMLSLSPNKYGNLVYEALKNMNLEEGFQDALRIVKDLISFAQSNLADGSDESLRELQEHYGINLPSRLSEKDTFNLVRSIMNQGEQMAKAGHISYDDQIWLAVKWGAKPQQYDFVMVDEGQDMSKAKTELAMSACKPGGRILVVGDPRQSIYGFAGADAQAVANIIERLNAKELPLSVSYRCPIAAIKSAQELVPHIEAAPNAIDGLVKTIKEDFFFDNVKPGDLVLCRLTAPLITTCIQMIKRRIPAKVKGRDIGKQLVMLAKDALGKKPWDEIHLALDEYMENQLPLLLKRRNAESAIQLLQDKIDGVRACVDGFTNVRSLADFATSVDSIFADETGTVELSTIHRAKGLEAHTVWVLKPGKVQLYWKGQRPWEAEQERNLDYVLRTRTKHTTYYVHEELKPKKEEVA